jgi:hypothetical protein
MYIHISVPIGTKHVATVRGSFLNVRTCQECQQPYGIPLDLEATGENYDLLFIDNRGSAERARQLAEEKLAKRSQNLVVPVPCPNCGHYDNEMATLLKDKASINGWQIGGALLLASSAVPLLFDAIHLWTASLAIGLVGLGRLVYGYVTAFRFDPNTTDREARKVVGRRHAVWGEQLAELLLADSATPRARADDVT